MAPKYRRDEVPSDRNATEDFAHRMHQGVSKTVGSRYGDICCPCCPPRSCFDVCAGGLSGGDVTRGDAERGVDCDVPGDSGGGESVLSGVKAIHTGSLSDDSLPLVFSALSRVGVVWVSGERAEGRGETVAGAASVRASRTRRSWISLRRRMARAPVGWRERLPLLDGLGGRPCGGGPVDVCVCVWALARVSA